MENNIYNYFDDIKNERSQIAQECFDYLNTETFYICKDNIFENKKECYVTIGSLWMFTPQGKPPKKIIEWFTKYIYRKYGYSIVDWL